MTTKSIDNIVNIWYVFMISCTSMVSWPGRKGRKWSINIIMHALCAKGLEVRKNWILIGTVIIAKGF